MYSVAESIGTTTILSSQGKYRTYPYYNKETGLTGFVGLDTSGAQFYFGCWIDGVAPSAEDFLFEYQEGDTQYSVQGNRNREAQYKLTVDRQDTYIDVAVMRIVDDYKVIPGITIVSTWQIKNSICSILGWVRAGIVPTRLFMSMGMVPWTELAPSYSVF